VIETCHAEDTPRNAEDAGTRIVHEVRTKEIEEPNYSHFVFQDFVVQDFVVPLLLSGSHHVCLPQVLEEVLS
jgi:hypothetical protein